MTPRQLQKWAKTRQMGRRRYVWLHGVLGWGFPVFLLTEATYVARYGRDDAPSHLLSGMIAWLIAGHLFGILMWMSAEGGYQRALEAEQDDQST